MINKKLFIVSIILLVLFNVNVNVNAINLTSVSDVNKNKNVGYLDNIYGNSYLEYNYRSSNVFSLDNNIYKYYPRIKKIDNYYILTYHGNKYSGSKTGGSVYYSISSDLITWSTPKKIWNPYNINDEENNDCSDIVLFANCDFIKLNNGKILFFAIYHSKKYYSSNPYKSGVVSRIGSIVNGDLVWDEGEKVDKLDSSCNKSGDYDIGAFIHTGPTWEPHAFYDNNGNVVMTFSSGEPINKNSNFNHSSGGVGTIVSQDNGNSWTDAKYSIFKFIGQYESNGKSVNYYTSQMAVTTPLTDGRYFSVYEMWAPNSDYGIPRGYSIGGTIFSSNYDFKTSSGIKVSDVITESLTDNPSLNDPRGQQSYSGNVKGFFTISNPAAAPYILQFPSGEVVVAFNDNHNNQFIKLITSLNNVYSSSDDLQIFNQGYWGSIDLNDSHSIISSFPNLSNYSINYAISYLNHTLNSSYLEKVNIDGNNVDWTSIDDALFVGSDSQAQAILRTSHDNDKINFLLEVKDENLTSQDEVILKIKFDNNIYNVLLNENGINMLDDNNNTININKQIVIINNSDSKKSGILYEFSVDKNKISYANEMKLFLLLNNKDDNYDLVQDKIFGTDENNQDSWITVKYIDNNTNNNSADVNNNLDDINTNTNTDDINDNEINEKDKINDNQNNNNDGVINDNKENINVEVIDSVYNTSSNISISLYIISCIFIISSIFVLIYIFKISKK